MLRVENLSHSYGGSVVLRDVSFTINTGERVGLIGPNGAGKTTLFKILSGLISASAGQIYVSEQEITKMPAHKRSSLGIALSFQINSLFPSLSLLDNIRLAVQGKKSTRFQMLKSIDAYTDIYSEAKEVLELGGLWEKRDWRVGDLAYGEQRELEILLALSARPKLLFMDEPSAGLTSGETADLIEAIGSLLLDTTFLFCAHHMELVFSLSERVMVLHNGTIIAQGTPTEIQANSKVREIYLGTV